MDYQCFLKSKMKNVIVSGFDIDYSQLNPMLFDFQKFTIKRAIKSGKYAVFADTGLGKTLMQLEIARLVTEHENGNVLILAPLAVTGQTIDKGTDMGISVERGKGRIQINNYEQIDNIDCSNYCCIILDESSCLNPISFGWLYIIAHVDTNS